MRRSLFAAVIAGVVTLAACGSDAKPVAEVTTPAPSSAAPATSTTAAAQTVPHRIISLSPTGTEMLYAIGAGDEVLAVDDQSNYPPEVLQKPHDLSGYQPNVEAIAALKPDLVVIGDDSSGISKQLESIGLHTWVGEAATSFDDVYDQIQQLGTVTGHTNDATELVTHMRTDIQAAVAAAPKGSTALTYYHEIDNTYYSITENTFIGQVYSLFGLRSIADMQEVSSDYPQLSAEAIISANPDFIFLADGNFGESPQTVAARPGWSDLKAVQHDDVIVVDPDLSSRWGPRIVQFIQMVSAAVTKAVAAS